MGGTGSGRRKRPVTQREINAVLQEDAEDLAIALNLSPEKRKQLLTLIATSPLSANVERISAIKTLDSMEKNAEGPAFGPPPPTRFEDQVSRLAALMNAVGMEVTDAARTVAMKMERVSANMEVAASGKVQNENPPEAVPTAATTDKLPELPGTA